MKNYPLIPGKGHRSVLAVLASVEIMQPTLDYNGLLTEDVVTRLPKEAKRSLGGRAGVTRTLQRLELAGYVVSGASRVEGVNGIFQSWRITANPWKSE